ncbi:hypothetical protein VXS05_19430, partial [Photobacterium toruni]|uniref:hypothetical protein n=1 Tax=Photobacterium toruni TaxID=1935446 RepID=UPI002E177A6B|nr:hypothetical protein [Photobacterium toruni]
MIKRRLLLSLLGMFVFISFNSKAENSIGVIIGSKSFQSSPSNREKLCVINGFKETQNIKLNIYENKHSKFGTYNALKRVKENYVALPLLTNEIPEIKDFNPNKKYFLSSSRGYEKKSSSFINIMPTLDEQVKFVLNYLNGVDFIFVGNDEAYSLNIKKELGKYKVFESFDIDEISNIKDDEKIIILALPLRDTVNTLNGLNKIRGLNILSFDTGALRKDEIEHVKSLSNINYKYVKNWNGIVTKEFMDVYYLYCGK